MCRLENLQRLLVLQDGITTQGEFIVFLIDPGYNILILIWNSGRIQNLLMYR